VSAIAARLDRLRRELQISGDPEEQGLVAPALSRRERVAARSAALRSKQINDRCINQDENSNTSEDSGPETFPRVHPLMIVAERPEERDWIGSLRQHPNKQEKQSKLRAVRARELKKSDLVLMNNLMRMNAMVSLHILDKLTILRTRDLGGTNP